jgi:Zn-finger nucleic acid-binding protein
VSEGTDGLRCPRCGRLWWPDDGGREGGAFASRCPSCGGTFLASHEVELVLGEELGYSIGDLRAAARAPAEDRGACPACGGKLHTARFEDTLVDLCTRCGSAWLDAGELEHLTRGRHLERAPPQLAAREYLPDSVAPGQQRRFVRIPEVSAARKMAGGVAAMTGLIGVVFMPISLIALPGILAAYQRGARFDTQLRRVAPESTVGVSTRGTWRRWDEFDEIVVYGKSDGRRVGKRLVKWSPSLEDSTHQQPRLEIARTTSRVLAHRWAFQASQLTGLQVRTPDVDQG